MESNKNGENEELILNLCNNHVSRTPHVIPQKPIHAAGVQTVKKNLATNELILIANVSLKVNLFCT